MERRGDANNKLINSTSDMQLLIIASPSIPSFLHFSFAFVSLTKTSRKLHNDDKDLNKDKFVFLKRRQMFAQQFPVH